MKLEVDDLEGASAEDLKKAIEDYSSGMRGSAYTECAAVAKSVLTKWN